MQALKTIIILKLSYIVYSILNIRPLKLVLIKKNQQLHSQSQYWNGNEAATDHGGFVHKANCSVTVVRKHNGSFAKTNVHKTIRYRDFKHFDEHQFVEQLTNVPWSLISMADDVDEKLDLFEQLYLSVLNNHPPIIEKSIRQPPWFIADLGKLILDRDRLFNSYKHSHDPNASTAYKRAKNHVNHEIRKAKREFYIKTLEQQRPNPREIVKSQHHDITLALTGQGDYILSHQFKSIHKPIDILASITKEKRDRHYNKFKRQTALINPRTVTSTNAKLTVTGPTNGGEKPGQVKDICQNLKYK